ncbi:MAG: FTR1 family protein [Rhodomicrobium sp.]|jgi:high-affinity iron transporter
MLAAAIIVFREVIEAGLIVGIVLAATRGVRGRIGYVLGGIVAGLVGAGLLAAFMGSISSALNGVGQEIFNASVLGVAVLMLGWHNVWMATHGRQLAAESVAAGQAVASGAKTLMALAFVVGIAVLREGSEAVLILYGILIENADGVWSTFFGGLLGLAGGVALSFAMFFGLVLIPSRYLFSVTSYLIAFLAAGMASQCVHFLDQADILNALSTTAWDTSWLLGASSIAGRVLHTLLGYDDRPSVMQVVVYLATLITILAAMRVLAPGKPRPKPALQETPAPAKPRVTA